MSDAQRYAVIEGGIVTNIILATEEFAAAQTPPLVEAGEGCMIGGTYEGGEFGPVPPAPLDDRKAELLKEIDATRDARIEGGFVHEVRGTPYTFQSRPSDRENILGLTIAAGGKIAEGAEPDDYEWLTPGQPFAFITADNSLAPMDAYDMQALYGRGLEFKAGQTFYARALKDAVLAAPDHATLDAIMAGADWPD